jgi:hypothetical protein
MFNLEQEGSGGSTIIRGTIESLSLSHSSRWLFDEVSKPCNSVDMQSKNASIAPCQRAAILMNTTGLTKLTFIIHPFREEIVPHEG